MTMIRTRTIRQRTYSELVRLSTFNERYNYLRIGGNVGVETFGFDRYLNQALYTSPRWRKIRRDIIIRDNGCDLAVPNFYISDKILVHHMNPITIRDIEEDSDDIFNPEFLVCVSRDTHNAIHYGDEKKLPVFEFAERRRNDTCPWKE